MTTPTEHTSQGEASDSAGVFPQADEKTVQDAGSHPSSGRALINGRTSLLLMVVVFCVSFASFVQTASRRDILRSPPLNGGDEDSYERLGFNLAAGLGFGYCPSDQAILSGAGEPEPTPVCQQGCSAAEFSPTAYRPPGFPLLIAAVYHFSPLNFYAVRLINCGLCALAVAVVAYVFSRYISVLAGIGVVLLCCIDPRLREFAGTFLTENMATLMFSLFGVSLAGFVQTRTTRSALCCGLLLSALVLTRSFYVAWYPFLWITAAVSLWIGHEHAALTGPRAFRSLMVFCTASLLLTGPWWVRNCLVLNALMPTGTQGGIGIADGFSDSAVQNFGSWTPTTANRIAAEIAADPNLQHLTAIEREKEHCRRGSAAAKKWIGENRSQLLRLSWWKLSRLWEYGSVLHGMLFSTMLAGLYFQRSHSLSRMTCLLLILNSLTVMATYHTYERFITPFRPLIHGFAICGLEGIARLLWQRLRR
jgi:hypothetical protein